MLRELHISNLAVIEDLTVELSEGLNCFTGQTGAGKSLILGAFEMLLGLRAFSSADVLRPGAEEARITGAFEVRDAWTAKRAGEAIDQQLTVGEQVIVTRKFFASGRSSVSVNGQPATAAMVRQMGEHLVDIHGQHDHQFLLKPFNQLLILDSFAKAIDLREAFIAAHAEWKSQVRRKAELEASRSLRQQQLELYDFQAQEIDAVAPGEGEFAEVRARHALLSNLEKVRRESNQAYHALHESEGSILERLAMVSHVLQGLAEIDPGVREIADQVRGASASLQDATLALNRHTDRLDVDDREIAEVADRVNTLNRLIAKYGQRGATPGDDPLAAVIAHRRQIGEQIEKLRSQNEDLEQIEGQIAVAQQQMAEIGDRLSEARRKATVKLRPQVEAQMKDLGMSEAEFMVEFSSGSARGSDDAVPMDAEPEGNSTGLESIEMMVRTNPGQPARPLRKIASGGEMSRIMLALKSILAQADRTSVLVFDEIDANIGGRMGTVIGQKLRELANGGAEAASSAIASKSASAGKGKRPAATSKATATVALSGHQVICITHLPQIAAFADRHLRIAKAVDGAGNERRTRTSVTALSGTARIEELSEMLAGKGVTDTTRKQAREMLAAAGA